MLSLIILIIFLPLVVFPNVFNAYEYGKFLLFVTGVETLFFMTLIFTRKNFKIPSDRLSGLIYLFIFITLISDLFGIDIKTSLLGSEWRLQGFLTLFSGGILYVLVKNYFKEADKKFFNSSVLTGSLLLSFVAIYQGITFHFVAGSNIATYQGRIVGTMGNPNFLAGILSMMLPFILFASFANKGFVFSKISNKSFNFIIKMASTVLILTAISLTGSRSGMISTGFVIFLALTYYFRKQKFRNLFIGITAVCLVFVFLQTSIKTQRISVWDNRDLIWREGIKAISARPILGYGQENFELIYPKERHVKVDSAHNIFIEVGVSSGVVGLVLFILLLLTALKEAVFPIKLSIAVFIISGFFNPLSIAQIAFFWMVLGLTKTRFEA